MARSRAFYASSAGARETRELGLPGAVPWRDAWVSWDRAGVHIDRVSGRTSVLFALDVGEAARTPQLFRRVEAGLLELWAEDALHGVVDLEAERAFLFDFPLVRTPERSVGTAADFGFWLAAVDGTPRRSFNLASGQFFRHRLAAGFEPVASPPCTPVASVLPGGDFGVLLRGPERTGAYVLDVLGELAPRPIGLPLRGVAFGRVQPAGSYLVVGATDGRRSPCPPAEPDESPPAAGELVGDSLQLVGPEGAQALGAGETLAAYLDPAGRCAFVADESAPEEPALLDLTDGRRLPLAAEWRPLETLPLALF